MNLRHLSWLAYGLGAVVMVAQARQLARPLTASAPWLCRLCWRFAVLTRCGLRSRKSYALLVLLVALGWAAAGLTHFYGLFVFLAAAVWDGCCRRWRLMAAAVAGVLPACLWIGYASAYLFSSRSASWIGTPDFALLETSGQALGPCTLPKLAVLALVLWALRRWGLRNDDSLHRG